MADMVYMYNADLWCSECGRAIKKRIRAEGHAPKTPSDESSFDSDEYPKGPFSDGGGEADSPQHCGAGEDCLEPYVLKDGSKVGKFLGNDLTAEGEEYVKGLHATNPTEITEFWMQVYNLSVDSSDTEDDDEEADLVEVRPDCEGQTYLFRE
jgi:hypothetical protein